MLRHVGLMSGCNSKSQLLTCWIHAEPHCQFSFIVYSIEALLKNTPFTMNRGLWELHFPHFQMGWIILPANIKKISSHIIGQMGCLVVVLLHCTVLALSFVNSAQWRLLTWLLPGWTAHYTVVRRGFYLRTNCSDNTTLVKTVELWKTAFLFKSNMTKKNESKDSLKVLQLCYFATRGETDFHLPNGCLLQ